MTTAVRLRAAGASDPGLQRRNNEDRFHADPQRGIFFVVDGVGGSAAGEVAAGIATEVLRSRLERRTGTSEERVREAITLANREILRQAEAAPEYEGMACVLTVVLVEDDKVTVGHVGDSRLYEVRRSSIRQVTRDHSPVGVMEAEGRLSEAEAMRHPRRSEVYRDVGSAPHAPDDPEFIETSELVLEPQAALLLCTDGLSDQVSSRAILQIVRAGANDPDSAARRLIDAANEAGGKDNVTVVLVYGERFAGRASADGLSDAAIDPRSEASGKGAALWSRADRIGVLAIAIAMFALGVAAATLLVRARAPDTLPAAVEPAASRTLIVGSADAPFQTLAAALTEARPGDLVVVRPGTYSEEIALKDGVSVVSRPRREATLVPTAGASAEGPATEPPIAVSAVGVKGARLSGFVIRSDAEWPLSVGVRLRDASVELDDLEITGAGRAAVDISGTGEPVLRASDLHDNPGTGIAVRDAARPLLAHNIVRRNGQSGGRPGVDVEGDARPVLTGNVISENGAEAVWMPPPADPTLVERNIFGPSPRGRGRQPIRIIGPEHDARRP